MPRPATARKPPAAPAAPAVPVAPTALPASSAGRAAATAACADKRERILAVAEELFDRHGFAGTTVDMICEALGVTKPYVYYYFADKHAIVETIARRASVACLSTLKFAAGDARPAHLRLAEGLRRWVAACVAHSRGSALAFRVTAALRPEFRAELRDLANDFYADLRALMEAGRREGMLEFDDAAVTAKAMGGVVGFMYTWYRPGGRLPPDELTAQLTAILCRMVGLRPEPGGGAGAATHAAAAALPARARAGARTTVRAPARTAPPTPARRKRP